MVRVTDLDASLDFYCRKLGLKEVSRVDNEAGRFTLVFLCAPGDEQAARENRAPTVELTYGRLVSRTSVAPGDEQAAKENRAPTVELTHNWDPEAYQGGRNFGHLAYAVDDIYATCQRLMDGGVVINRPPRDGRMAFVRSPDNISIELLQKGQALAPAEPWASMQNTGAW